jgi:hypothetical protein
VNLPSGIDSSITSSTLVDGTDWYEVSIRLLVFSNIIAENQLKVNIKRRINSFKKYKSKI